MRYLHFPKTRGNKKYQSAHMGVLKGVLHLLPQKALKLACFVLYLKIINIVLKNNITSYVNLSK